ncbi:MAG: exo-beta-N-acetylmuramidase NamZ family protein [Candidatus Rifleibacteriota bacterium]
MIKRNGHIFPVFIFLVSICIFFATPIINSAPLVTTGLDVLATQHPEMVRGKNIALLTSKTAYDKNLNHSIDRLAKAAKIEIIFTSDRDFRETIPLQNRKGKRDALTNALIYQINDPLDRPPEDAFQNVELLVIDVQDIGIRYFKYITILAQFLDLANEIELPVILLDRPNPINCTKIAGPVLETSLRSRFGVYPVPLIYGMTIGELALYFNKVFGLGADLTVVGLEGYSRDMSYEETRLCWFPPSNHIPEPDSPYYYATTGFLGELGVFSTGVGTTRPFHYILAPWIDGELLAKKLQKHKLPGVKFIPIKLKPYYGLFSGKETSGIEIFITDKISYEPFLTGIGILKALWELYPDRVPLRNPAAAEAIDTLLGSSTVREKILAGEPLMMIYASLKPDLADYLKKRREFIIYND